MSSLDLRLALPDTYQVVGLSPVLMKCREHSGGHETLKVYPDHIHCYYGKCSLHLSGLDALKYLLKRDDVDVARYTSESLDAYRSRAGEQARRDPLAPALANAYHKMLLTIRADAQSWFLSRGISWETMERANLGHDGFRFTIPIYDDAGRLLTIRYRRDDTYDKRGPKYCGLPGRNGAYLYGENLLACEPFEYVVVCEGELDSLRVWQEGVPACSVTNGAGQVPKIPAMLREAFPRIQHLYLATDMDEAGRESARLTQEAAEALGFEVKVLEWPEERGKDITEAMMNGLVLEELMNG